MPRYLKERLRRWFILRSLPQEIRQLRKQYQGKAIAIASNGPSLVRMDYHDNQRILTELGDLSHLTIPLWTVNGGWFYHPQSVLGFNMDDIEVDEWWDGCELEFNRNNIKNASIPIFTSTVYGKYPSLLAFPLKACVDYFQFAYFNETMNYMIALAVMFGVKEIQLYGTDYSDQHECPEERASNEFWLGVAHAHGVKVKIGKESTLFKGKFREGMHPKFYGYRLDNFADTGISDTTVHDRIALYQAHLERQKAMQAKASTTKYAVLVGPEKGAILKAYYGNLRKKAQDIGLQELPAVTENIS